MVTECPKACENNKSPDKSTDAKPCAAKTAVKKSTQEKDTSGTEQAPEVTTSTADDAQCAAKTSTEEVALILSAEEESELCPATNEEVKDKSKPVTEEKEEANKAKKKLTKKPAKSLWVSNISKGTKAADLKKLFSENFKVESAKIVTNGKCFFGYITLETADMVQKAVKDLNGFNLAGKIISVSFMRPDLRNSTRANIEEQKKQVKEKLRKSLADSNQEGKDPVKKEDEANADKEKATNGEKAADGAKATNGDKTTNGEKDTDREKPKDSSEKPTEKKQDSQASETTKTEVKEKKPASKSDKTPDKSEKLINDLKKELGKTNDELRATKKRLRDANSRIDFERKRKSELLRQVSKLEDQLKAEKRKISQERQEIEKQKKINDLRYEEDRSVINRELEECKRLREYLQTRADELVARPRHRSRSPISRSPTRRSAPSGRSMPERGHDNKNPRSSRPLHISPPKRGYENAQTRQRSPPPPPKLSKRSSSPPRGHDRSPPYKSSKKGRMEYASMSSFSSSGPSGGSKDHSSSMHYPQPSTMSAPSRVGMWNTSYKMPYSYRPSQPQTAYPLVSSTVMQMAPSNSARSLEYSEYSKRVAGGLRKY